MIRWKPVRNELGQVTSEAMIAFCAPGEVPETNMIAIPVKGALLITLSVAMWWSLPTHVGANEFFRSSMPMNRLAFARMIGPATSSKGRGCACCAGADVVCEDEVGDSSGGRARTLS